MLKIEDIDINNKEAITYLRSMMVQFLEKYKAYLVEIERKNKTRIDRLKEDWNKIDTPQEKATKQTVFNNIIFFIGSLISPAVTPSELFGKAKVDQNTIDEYNRLSQMHHGLIEVSRNAIEAAVESIMAISKALADINTKDESLIRLFVELNNQYEMNQEMQIVPFVDAMYACGYYNPETFNKIREKVEGTTDVKNSIIMIITEYMNRYGSDVMQKGR